MKHFISVLFILFLLILSGCGTIFGGRISSCQRQKPAPGQPKRQIRPAALAADIAGGLFLYEIPTLVDFLDGGVYKPCGNDSINDVIIHKDEHKSDSIAQQGLAERVGSRTISISTDAMQYIMPQPNINIEYAWNRMAIGLYGGIIRPDFGTEVNTFANGQYTLPGNVYYGKAFKLYFKYYDSRKPNRYWCAQLICKPEWYNNQSFMDMPQEELRAYYTMNEICTVWGLDLLRGHELAGKNIVHVDFFYGIGIHDRMRTYTVTSSNTAYPYYGYMQLGTFKGYIMYPTPVIGLKLGFNYSRKR
jgi:hypothetical protein